MRRGWTSGVPLRIGKRHSQDFVVGVQLERFDASVSVPVEERLLVPFQAGAWKVENSHEPASV